MSTSTDQRGRHRVGCCGFHAEDLRLALRAATLYYLDGLTQAEIAAGSASPGRRRAG